MASSGATIDIVVPIDRQFAMKSRFLEEDGANKRTDGHHWNSANRPLSRGPDIVQPTVKGKTWILFLHSSLEVFLPALPVPKKEKLKEGKTNF